MSCDIFIEKWLIWLPGRGAVWETDHSNSQAVKSPIIWWMVYLPNRWGETCIEIKRAGLFFFLFGTCPGHGNRLEIWIIRLCSPSGSKLEMNSSCEWFSTANNAVRRVYHPWLSCSGGVGDGFIDCEASHLCGFLHQPPVLLKDLEQKCGDLWLIPSA